MKIDMHCHVSGSGTRLDEVDRDVYFNPADNNHWFTRILYKLIESNLASMGGDPGGDGTISTDDYLGLIYTLLATSEELDGLVLLALDALYSPETGALDERRTDLWVSNRFLASKVEELNRRLQAEPDPGDRGGRLAKRFFFAASVSPNRPDWRDELDFVVGETEAVALKWIPSAQHIRADDPRHNAFYDALAAARLPLLCHVGPEYSFPEGIRNMPLDDFRFLDRPLERGVTVIAAHCASPVFTLVDKNEMQEFFAFMQRANADGTVRLWSDTSALSLSTRVSLLPGIVRTFPPEWLVNGSDFPVPIDSWAHLPWLTPGLTPAEYLRIVRTKNPLDRDVRIKRAHGFSDAILENAEKILRLPAK